MSIAALPTIGAFFDELYAGCDGVVELRALLPPTSYFAPLTDRDGLRAFLRTHGDCQQDLYMGVATRKDDSSGGKDNLVSLAALFCDLDFKTSSEEEARQRLADFALPPSCVVHSGGGLHCYWFLKEPFDLQQPADVAQAEALLRRLAAALQADASAAGVARVLRIPKTRNFKYDPPRLTRIDYWDPAARYNPSDFDEVLPADPAPPVSAGPYTAPHDVQPGERNKELFKLARSMKGKKLPASAILEALRGYNKTFSVPHVDAEVVRAFDSAMRQPDRKLKPPKDDPPPAEPVPDDAPSAHTDPGEPVNLADLLDDLVVYVRRFVVLTPVQASAVALWTAHTHVADAAESTPYQHITAGTKRAGKTLLLEVLEPVVRRPWLTGRTTSAALARKIDGDRPTLLLDETDQTLREKSDYAAALIGILNSGYRASGRVSLCVGEGSGLAVQDLNTFCPKAFAGIGKLPDTIADRSIVIKLRRRTPREKVDRARQRIVRGAAKPLRDALEQWSVAALQVLKGAEPALPEALNDRAQDVWEPLLAIADLAGDKWGTRARAAALELSGEQVDDDMGVQLLADIRGLMEQSDLLIDGIVPSTRLLKRLVRLPDRPWATWSRGGEMTGHALARLLGGFDLHPDRYRVAGDKWIRGYRGDAFPDAFSRYLPPVNDTEVSQRHNPNKNGGENGIYVSVTKPEGDTYVKPQNVNEYRGLRHRDTSKPSTEPVPGFVHEPADPDLPAEAIAEREAAALDDLTADLVASGLVAPGTPVEVLHPEDDEADEDLPQETRDYRRRVRARARAMAKGGAHDTVN
jgi:hypothetical protein